ncbi:MAG: hypothetical protein AAF532_15930 [Planctomycetota bacterium]
MRTLGLSVVLAFAAAASAVEPAELVFEDGFEQGFERWDVFAPETWAVSAADGDPAVEITARKSAYTPPHRSPGHVALVKDLVVGDVEITFRVRSTKDTGKHRDCCIFFGWQDPAHFYYVHLGARPDPNSGQVMVVDGAPRRPLTTNEKETPWTDGWHKVRLTRDVASGEIAVYFDDMDTPHMSVVDHTYGSGRVGIGSFDDMNAFDDVRISSR